MPGISHNPLLLSPVSWTGGAFMPHLVVTTPATGFYPVLEQPVSSLTSEQSQWHEPSQAVSSLWSYQTLYPSTADLRASEISLASSELPDYSHSVETELFGVMTCFQTALKEIGWGQFAKNLPWLNAGLRHSDVRRSKCADLPNHQ